MTRPMTADELQAMHDRHQRNREDFEKFIQRNRAISYEMLGPDKDHEHQWGDVQTAHFTGNPHRKCQVSGCSWVSLDLYDDDDDDA